MSEKTGKKSKLAVLLAVSLALILVGSFLAGMFNSSFYSVDVSRVEIDGDHGTMTALLYMPKGAGPENPRPVIVTTHGYLNTKEMQDAPAIEMSRRGYIVLAVDMYDHGDSRWAEEIPIGGHFGTFWIWAQLDAAKYAYGQDYTLKDENGNGYVAVSGHSMGGFSTLIAMYMDEMQSLATGVRMIYTGISAGADYSYAAAVATQDQYQAAFGSRTVGMIAAHYDEFFFNKTDAEKTEAEKAVLGTVTYKDFCATESGKAFLGVGAGETAEAGKIYTVNSGELTMEGTALRGSEIGERIIYTPNEIHPWNHFSTETTGNFIQFYNYAFADVMPEGADKLGTGNQIWWAKELFSFVALIGFFIFIAAFAGLLIKLPFLKKAVTEELAPIPAADKPLKKIIFWAAIVFSTIYPAWLFATLMDKQAAGLSTLGIVALCVGAAALLGGVVALLVKGNESKKSMIIGGVIVAVICVGVFLVTKFSAMIVPLAHYFNSPIPNGIVFWAMINGVIAIVFTLLFFFFDKKPAGARFASYGVAVNPLAILASLIVAVLTVAAGYALLFGTQAIFGTDFRIWTLAVRTFTGEHLITSLRYMPLFLIYYFANSWALNANTRSMKKGWGYFWAIVLNIGGLVGWLALQYGGDFLTGVGAFPGQALNGIVLIALVPCLAVAAVYARRAYEKTNNVWLGAFINTILFTIITCANTAVFWNFASLSSVMG